MELRSILKARRVSDDAWVETGNIRNLTFLIKPYQRGYRWGKSNVRKLLEDIDQYLKSVNNDLLAYTLTTGKADQTSIYDFYCLQALAVKQEAPTDYELIDGQQRLTTILLIYELLCAFTQSKDEQADRAPYRLLYQRSGKDGSDFDLSKHIHDRIPFKVEGCASVKAYKAGVGNRDKDWFQQYKANLKKNLRSKSEDDDNKTTSDTIDLYYLSEVAEEIVDFIYTYADDEDNCDHLMNLYKCFQRNVLFLWYDIPTEVAAVDEFTSLNSNKVELTDAELIKALVLKADEKGNMFQDAAHRWEAIEQGLCRPELWSFISDTDKATRIDLILDLFARKCDSHYSSSDGKSTNKYALFDWYEKLNQTLQNEGEKGFSETVICGIEEIYARICEWYDDVDIYHYIGLLTCFRAKLIKKKSQEQLIQDVFARYNDSQSRNDFIGKLKQEIKKCILYGVSEEEYPHSIEDVENCFSYAEDQKENLKAILWLLNAWETIEAAENNIFEKNTKQRQPVVITRLPFSQINGDLKTAKKWTLEHIMPQHPDNDKDSSHEGKEAYNNLLEQIRKGDIAVVTNDDVHKIGNMALLTHGTNSEIKNGNLAGKRNDIIRMVGEGKYVPGSTINAFSLYYNILDENHTDTPADATYWTVANKNSYLKRIETCLRAHDIITDAPASLPDTQNEEVSSNE